MNGTISNKESEIRKENIVTHPKEKLKIKNIEK